MDQFIQAYASSHRARKHAVTRHRLPLTFVRSVLLAESKRIQVPWHCEKYFYFRATLHNDEVSYRLERGRYVQLQRACAIWIHLIRSHVIPRNNHPLIVLICGAHRIHSVQSSVTVKLVIAADGKGKTSSNLAFGPSVSAKL